MRAVTNIFPDPTSAFRLRRLVADSLERLVRLIFIHPGFIGPPKARISHKKQMPGTTANASASAYRDIRAVIGPVWCA